MAIKREADQDVVATLQNTVTDCNARASNLDLLGLSLEFLFNYERQMTVKSLVVFAIQLLGFGRQTSCESIVHGCLKDVRK